MSLQHVHGQTPVATLTEDDYATLLVHLGEQLAACCVREGYPSDQAPDAAVDALESEFGTANDQTIGQWLTAAARRLCVNSLNCVGV